MFWYEIGGFVETGEYATKLRTLWRTIARHRTDGAVVFVSAVPTPRKSEAESVADLEDLAPHLHLALTGLLSRGL